MYPAAVVRAPILLLSFTLACSSQPSPSGEVGAGGADGGGISAGVGASGGVDEPRIVLPATEGELALDFDVAIAGDGSSFIGALDLQNGSGTVEVGGQLLPVVAYERQPFGDWLLFQLLAVQSDRWYVLWAYCQGSDLTWIYFEGTDGTRLDAEPASGSCLDGPGPTAAAVGFPAVDMPLPPLIDGFAIEGPSVSLLGAAPGWVDLGTRHTVLAFDEVDCTADCGSPGWREVHSILWDEVAARACFAIFYLFDGAPEVLLAYALTLPDLSDPAGDVGLAARWSYQR